MGFRQVSGIGEEDIVSLIAGRVRPYTSIQAMQEAGVAVSTLEKLADADAFRSMGLDRRKALWMVTGLTKDNTVRQRDKNGAIRITQQLDLFTASPTHSLIEEGVQLIEMSDSEHVVYDYQSLSLSLKAHPVSFLRKNLEALNNIPSNLLPRRRNGEYIHVAGRVLVRQRPGTAKGTCFITIEDETGSINLIAWASIFDEYRKEILGAKLLMVYGHLQIEKGVIHVVVQRCFNLNFLLNQLTPSDGEDFPLPAVNRADQKSAARRHSAQKQEEAPALKQAKFLAEARNFK